MEWEEKRFSSKGGFTMMNVLVRKSKVGSVRGGQDRIDTVG